MRITHNSVEEKFANLILEKRIKFSGFLEELSEAIENKIRESKGEALTFDETDEEILRHGHGRDYHDFALLNDFEPHDSIKDKVSQEEIDVLSSFSENGDINVDVMRINRGRTISHEWQLTLHVSESPHASSGRLIKLRIVLEFIFGRHEKIKISNVNYDIDNEDLSKIFMIYSLKYD